MMKSLLASVLPALLLSACTSPSADAPAPAPATPTGAIAAPSQPADDGTYLARIDPLGGQWEVARLGQEDFRRYAATIGFSDGGFLNHGAGCRGGHPAFYFLSGASLRIARREPVRTGKCGDGRPDPAAAARSELRLGRFLDSATRWRREGDRLLITAADGTEALLLRPAEPHPELAGRWRIEAIGGRPFVTERRPATLTIGRTSIGVDADCNRLGTSFSVPAPGRLRITGGMIGTLIGCAAEDQAEDGAMAGAIAGATGYRIEGDRLILTGGPGLVARRFPPPDRALAGDYVHCGNTLLGAAHAGEVALTFTHRTVRDNAGCEARFTARGPDLILTLGGAPACRQSAPPYRPGLPAEIGGSLSPLAIARPDGFAFAEDGRLILRTNRGLLSMCRRGQPMPFGSG